MSHIATPHVCVALRGSGSGVGGPSAALLYGELTWCRRLLTYGFHPHTQGSLLDPHCPSSPLLRAASETWWHVHAEPLPSALLNSVTYARVKATVSRSRGDIGSSQTLTVGLNQCDGCVRPNTRAFARLRARSGIVGALPGGEPNETLAAHCSTAHRHPLHLTCGTRS